MIVFRGAIQRVYTGGCTTGRDRFWRATKVLLKGSFVSDSDGGIHVGIPVALDPLEVDVEQRLERFEFCLKEVGPLIRSVDSHSKRNTVFPLEDRGLLPSCATYGTVGQAAYILEGGVGEALEDVCGDADQSGRHGDGGFNYDFVIALSGDGGCCSDG